MSDMWPDIYLGKKKYPIPTGHHQQSFNINFHFSYFFHSRLLNLVLSVANIKDPFSYSSEHLLEKKKRLSISNPMQVPWSHHSNFQASLCGFLEDHGEMISFVSHH